jgi:hypothetical protein
MFMSLFFVYLICKCRPIRLQWYPIAIKAHTTISPYVNKYILLLLLLLPLLLLLASLLLRHANTYFVLVAMKLQLQQKLNYT